jgi:sporulation protein YlmC with PRC-barrel domain
MGPTGSSGAMNSAGNARAGLQEDPGGLFANVPAQTGLSSKVVGLTVYNSENADLGTIKDIAFDANGVKAYIVAVGGFLGMGDHYVAVRPSAINITYDATKDKWQALMSTNVDQLKSAPEFKYSSAG